MPAKEHDEDCPLYPQHWLRHALSAVQQLTADDPEDDVDRLSAASLLNALDYFANHHGWEGVTLRNVADYATLMEEDKFPLCDCKGPSRLTW
ncbi:hypothetical protein [Blastococcus sp. SYSU DS0617]